MVRPRCVCSRTPLSGGGAAPPRSSLFNNDKYSDKVPNTRTQAARTVARCLILLNNSSLSCYAIVRAGTVNRKVEEEPCTAMQCNVLRIFSTPARFLEDRISKFSPLPKYFSYANPTLVQQRVLKRASLSWNAGSSLINCNGGGIEGGGRKKEPEHP